MKTRSLRALLLRALPPRPTTSRTRLAALIFLVAALFGAAACGSTTSTTTTTGDAMQDADNASTAADNASGDMADDHGDDHSDGDHSDDHSDDDHGDDHSDGDHSDGHGEGHGEPIELAADLPTPSLTLEVFADPKSGWNVHATPTNHTIAAASASTPHVDGEGHMHLYVDGTRVGRIYNEWVHLGDLTPGDHEIRVELSANSHAPIAVDGEIVDQTVTITQPDTDDAGGHHHSMEIDVSTLDPAPAVTLEVFEDPKSGWNIHAVATNHTMAPESASTPHVDGEGHMHLYVDGKKVTRLYGEWYHVDGLHSGEHTIRVELSANSHAALAIDGTLVDQTVTITETRTSFDHGDEGHGDDHGADSADDHGDAAMQDASDDDHSHDHAHEVTSDGSDQLADVDSTITLMVMGDEISGDTGRQKVDQGAMVGIVVSSNVADEVHLHGYDLLRPVGPDGDAVIVFEADIPGLFEVELEGSGELLFELQVS